jgi:hypothetical protein
MFTFCGSELLLRKVLVKFGNPVELRGFNRIEVHGGEIFTF